MDEDKDRRMNTEVIETREEPVESVENERRMEGRMTEQRSSTDTMTDEMEALFEQEEAEKFRTHWLNIQSKFVDDPRASVKQADELVASVLKSVTMSFADKRISLEKQWNSGEDASTEDLRVALKRYRSFFDRLLTLES
jgi:hypothetical protein